MTIEARASIPARARPEAPLLFAAVAGCVAIAARTPSWAAVGVTALVGVVGALVPAAREPRASRGAWTMVVVLGVVAFASVRLASLLPVSEPTATGIGIAVVAAFAEELFFRRFLYGVIVRSGAGPAVAIAVCAVAFAVVHIPAYGTAKLPINLAAGVLLGWQRWATGTWSAPAATHMAANVMSLV